MAKSNYEITRDRVKKEFVKYDQKKMIEKFHLKYDETCLYLKFLGREYRIFRSTGLTEWSEDNFLHVQEGSFEEVLTIFDVLCNSKDDCHLSGRYCKVESLKGIGYTGNPGKGSTDGAGQFFTHRMEALSKACRRLGGTEMGKGDVSFLIPVFDFLSVWLQFYDADDEFPAQLTLMWDENVLEYMRFETTFYAAGHLQKRLMELAGER